MHELITYLDQTVNSLAVNKTLHEKCLALGKTMNSRLSFLNVELRYFDNILQFNVRHTFFRNSYFPSIVTEWNNLGKSIRNSESFSIFKKNISKLIRPSSNSIFTCHNPKGVKLLTRLRLGLRHLRNHLRNYLQLWN